MTCPWGTRPVSMLQRVEEKRKWNGVSLETPHAGLAPWVTQEESEPAPVELSLVNLSAWKGWVGKGRDGLSAQA